MIDKATLIRALERNADIDYEEDEDGRPIAHYTWTADSVESLAESIFIAIDVHGLSDD